MTLYSKTGGLRLKSGKLLLLGLDNAGKTTLLSVLKAGHITQPMPTLHPSKQADEAIMQQHLTAHVASWKAFLDLMLRFIQYWMVFTIVWWWYLLTNGISCDTAKHLKHPMWSLISCICDRYSREYERATEDFVIVLDVIKGKVNFCNLLTG